MFALKLLPLLCMAYATTFHERPFEETVQDAPIIVRGKIGLSYTNWATGSDGSRRIHTFTELQIDDVLKGPLKPRSIMMRELGGEKDGVGMQVSGTAQFTRGEDVVVFLNSPSNAGSADEFYDVRGMMMGKYNVERDPSGKEYLIGAGITGQGHGHVGEQDDTRRWTIDALRDLVRSQEAQSTDKTGHAVSSKPQAKSEPEGQKDAQSQIPDQAAPQLQSSSSESVASSGSDFWMYLLLAAVAAGAVILFLKRRT